METTYKLNARDLTSNFLASIRDLFIDQDIEITVREADDPADETEYLLRSPVNRARLMEATRNVERNENIVMFDTLEQAMKCAEERAVL